MSARHHVNLTDSDVSRLGEIVGGHPYLAHAALWDLRDGHYDLDKLERNGPRQHGALANYLQRDQYRLHAAPVLGRAFTMLVERPDAHVPLEALDDLIRLGLVKQGREGSHPVRYPIFRHLLETTTAPTSPGAARLVYCYAHADQDRCARLETHLALLKRDGYIASYHDHPVEDDHRPEAVRCQAGQNGSGCRLDDAEVILLLITSEFLASRWIESPAGKRALDRHEAGEKLVVPIIVRSCDWEHPPLRRLPPVPKNGLPISRWMEKDDAWADVAQAVRVRLDSRSEPPLVPGSQRCKILFLSANPEPKSPLAVDREYRRIAKCLQTTRYRDRVELISWPDTHTSDLAKLLHDQRPDIVHFSGHGKPSGSLLMRNSTGLPHPVPPEVIASYLARRNDSVRLVVLNACYSQALARRLQDDIHCVVGMTTEVTDKAAITFAERFYEALFDNRPFDAAFGDSCSAIAAEGFRGSETPRISSRPGVSLDGVRLFSE